MKIHDSAHKYPRYRCDRCDRCGRDTRATDEYPQIDEHNNSLEGHVQLQGCYGSTRYDFLLMKAELCEDCTHQVLVWIDQGTGRGVSRVDMLEAEEAFSREYFASSADTIIRPISEPTRTALRRWIERRYRLTLLQDDPE